MRAVLGALQAVAATVVESELSREFGVAWIPRADGRGNEIRGVTQAQMDAYSTRTVQVREKERELARAWERKHGRAPTSRELLHIANAATLQSRKGKEAAAIDWAALARRWDATLGGDLAGIAPAVSNAGGPGAQAGEHHAGRAPSGPPAPEAQARALTKALVLVSDKHPAWTRHDLLKQLALVLPAETRQMSPEEAQELLLGLAEEALSGRSGEVLCLEAPEWPPLPVRAAPQSGRAQRLFASGCRAVRHRRAAVAGGTASCAGAGARRAARARPTGRAASWRRSCADTRRTGWPRKTRANITRSAGCGWTRRLQPGTRSPRLAPSK